MTAIKRAHTPEQKRQVVEALLAAWLAHPALRLGQLMEVLADSCPVFAIEDGVVQVLAEEWARK